MRSPMNGPREFIFFTDRDLGRQFPSILREAGVRVEGDQIFSGTIAGSDLVMIHDSKFRFEVNLATGAETG